MIAKLWFASIDRHIEIRIPRQHLHLMLIQNYYVVKRTTCQPIRMFNKHQLTELNLLTLYTSTVQLKTSWSGFRCLCFHSEWKNGEPIFWSLPNNSSEVLPNLFNVFKSRLNFLDVLNFWNDISFMTSTVMSSFEWCSSAHHSWANSRVSFFDIWQRNKQYNVKTMI